MVSPSNDDRPPLVVAMQWVQQITTVALEMALPAGLGYWLDGKWGTAPWLVICGAILGFIVSMSHLMQLAKASGSKRVRKDQGPTKG